jgi:hypothetical protein
MKQERWEQQKQTSAPADDDVQKTKKKKFIAVRSRLSARGEQRRNNRR